MIHLADEAAPLSDFLRCVRRFRDAQLPFMIVGAFAVSVHGTARHSKDIDVVVHLPFAERERLRPLMETIGTGDVDERRDPQWGQRLVTPLPSGLDLEVFFTYGHPLYAREYERRVEIEVEGTPVPFISPEDLILRKLVNARLRRGEDLRDAISVVKEQRGLLNEAYLREHCVPQRVCGLLEDVLDEAELPDRGT